MRQRNTLFLTHFKVWHSDSVCKHKIKASICTVWKTSLVIIVLREFVVNWGPYKNCIISSLHLYLHIKLVKIWICSALFVNCPYRQTTDYQSVMSKVKINEIQIWVLLVWHRIIFFITRVLKLYQRPWWFGCPNC